MSIPTGPATYLQWKNRGRRIHKGEVACGFLEGEPLFNFNQTYNPNQNWFVSKVRYSSEKQDPTSPYDDMPH